MLIACPTCGRLQFDMDTVVADIEERLRAYDEPIEVAVLGCAVNGIGEASHADFGITGAKNEGLIFAHGKPLRKVPQERLVDELFAEIDKSLADRPRSRSTRRKAAEGAKWLEQHRGGERRRADPGAPGGAGGGGRGRRGDGQRPGAADGGGAEGEAHRAGRGGQPHGGPALHAGLAARPLGSGPLPQRAVCSAAVISRSSTRTKAATTRGSNCVPAQRRSSASAAGSPMRWR